MVDIVPGITAASGAAAQLGLSLTHRDSAHSLRFVTGHGKDGGLAKDLDWAGLADPRTSTVFYMAGRTAVEIAARLVEAGLDTGTPVALVSAATRPETTVWRSDLSALAKGDASPLNGPVLLGIGQVFAAVAALPAEDHPTISEAV